MRSRDAERALDSSPVLQQSWTCTRHRPSASYKHKRPGARQQTLTNASLRQTRSSIGHANATSRERTGRRPVPMHPQAASASSDTVEDLRRAEGEGIASSQALADDAIIWASQHGLVAPPHACQTGSLFASERKLMTASLLQGAACQPHTLCARAGGGPGRRAAAPGAGARAARGRARPLPAAQLRAGLRGGTGLQRPHRPRRPRRRVPPPDARARRRV